MKIQYKRIAPWWKFWARYKYELTARHTDDTGITGYEAWTPGAWVYLHEDGIIEIARRYQWDGCSGPTWDTKTSMRAGLVHDALYQLMRSRQLPQGYVRSADRLFHNILREDGMNRFRARLYYRGVSTRFAHRAAKPKK